MIGFDVSAHNLPSAVPWGSVGFGFIRVSHGLGLDTSALEHMARAQAGGVACLGVYHYLRGDSEGARQAEFFFARAAQLEAGGGPLALAVDLEDLPPPAKPWGRATYAGTAIDFLRRLRALTSRPCVVYGSPSYLGGLDLPEELVGPLWVAQWGVVKPTVPKPWADWTIHQHEVKASLDRNKMRGEASDFGQIFGLLPLPYDTLGGVVTGVERAQGGRPEHYASHEEGPVIDHG